MASTIQDINAIVSFDLHTEYFGVLDFEAIPYLKNIAFV